MGTSVCNADPLGPEGPYASVPFLLHELKDLDLVLFAQCVYTKHLKTDHKSHLLNTVMHQA